MNDFIDIVKQRKDLELLNPPSNRQPSTSAAPALVQPVQSAASLSPKEQMMQRGLDPVAARIAQNRKSDLYSDAHGFPVRWSSLTKQEGYYKTDKDGFVRRTKKGEPQRSFKTKAKSGFFNSLRGIGAAMTGEVIPEFDRYQQKQDKAARDKALTATELEQSIARREFEGKMNAEAAKTAAYNRRTDAGDTKTIEAEDGSIWQNSGKGLEKVIGVDVDPETGEKITYNVKQREADLAKAQAALDVDVEVEEEEITEEGEEEIFRRESDPTIAESIIDYPSEIIKPFAQALGKIQGGLKSFFNTPVGSLGDISSQQAQKLFEKKLAERKAAIARGAGVIQQNKR